ncbi:MULTISPECIES: hypothetical protein [Bacteria]|jgi:hypothetical protein|uniref:Uncharacterized protein n=1 Tax=Burkholderia contaminans TaxID=488447 RepID=A0ABD7XXD9_9BURK|nr:MULTISPECIES: hypothetical protein [Bacteria]MBH9690969.1 hypothetical protein [Burkholderia contaminans]MBY4823360.1 hypothetical protein [Burkholderia contaminans]MBY4853650.1 hypothetical protein [Burkholderia contaminans]MBY4879965.1 hypothetical protein [Burkholderia contaminans]MCA7910902.1 hypothetical protein [Burkholderia contaminans]
MWRVIFDINGSFNNIFSLENLGEKQLTTKVLKTEQERPVAALMAIEDCRLNGLGHCNA